MPTSCKLTRSSTLQFPNGHILYHRIIVASFVEKGSKSAQGDRSVAFLLSISGLGVLHLLGTINQIFFQLIIVKPFSRISV
jgi:hypothetical protein